MKLPRSVKNPTQTKREILQAAEQLFLEKGYKQTTVEDILRAVQLSKGGFYHHFESKEEVLVSLIDQMMNQTMEAAEEIVSNTKINAVAKLERFFQKHVELKKTKMQLLFFFSSQDFSNVKIKQQKLFLQKYHPYLLTIVNQGIQEGSMCVTYPQETVEMLLVIFDYLRDYVPQILEDTQKAKQYLRSVEELIHRTLGITQLDLQLDQLIQQGKAE